MKIGACDRDFLDILKGASILRVMMVHLGLSWFYPPYSAYVGVLLPIFFFVSGAVSFNSVFNNSHRKFYFTKRYLALLIPFILFSLPFSIINWGDLKFTHVSSIIRWFLAWPPMDSYYPIDMRQLWFINALILMFFISYPIFVLSRKSIYILVIAFIFSLLYIPAAEYFNLIEVYKKNKILLEFSLPMQLHQTLALINYYFLGALFYQIKPPEKTKLLLITALLLILGIFLHPSLSAIGNIGLFFFSRGEYFTVLSYVCIFIILINRDTLLNLFNKLPNIKSLLLILSKNSYSLFLIHTSIILFFEKNLGFDDLGDKPALAIIKMIGVIAISIVIAPVITSINNKVLKLIK